MNKKIIGLVAGVSLASVASADQVSFDFQGVASGRNARISTHGGGYVNVFSGSVIHDIDSLRTVTYCIDPDQWAQTGTSNFEREALDEALSHRSESSEKAWAIAELAGAAGETLWTEAVDSDLASAFQIAVWEIVLDYSVAGGAASLDLGHGAFRAMSTSGGALSSAVLGHYDDLVGALSFGQAPIGGYEAYTSASHQDFVTKIPTPGTAVLSLAGLPFLASRRRR